MLYGVEFMTDVTWGAGQFTVGARRGAPTHYHVLRRLRVDLAIGTHSLFYIFAIRCTKQIESGRYVPTTHEKKKHKMNR